MKKIIFLFIPLMILLAGCGAYGLTGNPNKSNQKNEEESHSDEIEIMNNVKQFKVTIQSFETNLKEKDFYENLKETELGFISKDKLFKIDYKNPSSKQDEYLTNVYMIINEPYDNFDKIENNFRLFWNSIIASLEVPYDVEDVIMKIKEKHSGQIDNSEVLSVELTGANENIQIILNHK